MEAGKKALVPHKHADAVGKLAAAGFHIPKKWRHITVSYVARITKRVSGVRK